MGAGPAGLSTALHLAKYAPELAARTLILEKARHPRHKLCGGGLLPDAEVILASLGLDPGEVPHTDVDWAHFNFNARGLTLRPEKHGAYAFRTIRRNEFDAWLAGKARARGCRIIEQTTVRQVTVNQNGVCLDTDRGRYQASVVVGADGAGSVVRRALPPPRRMHVARLLEVVTPAGASIHRQEDAYFDFMVVPQGISGYVWDFPALQAGKPVRIRGIYDSNVISPRVGISLRAGLAAECQLHDLELEDCHLAGAPLRWFEPKSRFAAPHLLLVGDAAGVDALLGEGISIALGYGALAARAIQDAFSRSDFSFTGYKQEIMRSELGKALRRRTWFARLNYSLRSGSIQSLLWHRLGCLITWIARNFLLGWAHRQETKEKR